MKRFISMFMVIGALMCVLYIGVAAEPTSSDNAPISSITDETSSVEGEETSSNILGIVSIEGGESSSEETDGSSSEEVSSEETSSTETSSRYGANAYDPTVGQGGTEFGDPESDTTIEYVSKVVSTDNTNQKNIFNLSKILKGLIFIPVLLIVASIVALIYVNRKEFAGAKAKKKGDKAQNGRQVRKKTNRNK